jgi:hypothetical protein
MPNGEKIVFNWKEASPGNWFVESFKCGNNRIDVPGHGNPCRDAAVAAGVALLVCAGSPGSIACWGATATAAYHAYRCYEATHFAMIPNKTKNLRNYARRFQFGQKSANKQSNVKNLRLHNS